MLIELLAEVVDGFSGWGSGFREFSCEELGELGVGYWFKIFQHTEYPLLEGELPLLRHIVFRGLQTVTKR